MSKRKRVNLFCRLDPSRHLGPSSDKKSIKHHRHNFQQYVNSRRGLRDLTAMAQLAA